MPPEPLLGVTLLYSGVSAICVIKDIYVVGTTPTQLSARHNAPVTRFVLRHSLTVNMPTHMKAILSIFRFLCGF